ncbi:S8 family peptidase [Desulfonema magnum]|uniref:Peptidase S8/S53 domain-containing protein n=1 Tax=Desulfonema magnum TaxID=45655 RepID=A0A975GK26_9BACT|nr:S8 family peptidase [Desulfonema magnum]QTA84299.1 Peptidase S8/S53 domain-containing protein [Desulfonema magnum]
MKKVLSRTLLFTMAVIVSMMFSQVTAAGMVKKIVIFQENTQPPQRIDYLEGWEAAGVVTLRRVPFVDGAVLSVPDTITSAELADDDRVLRVEEDQQVELQAVVASGDGGAGDGGAGDGGAGDGGASEPIRFISPILDNAIFNGERPWGILQLYEQPYDPGFTMSLYDPNAVPQIVRDAMERSYLKHIKIAIFDTGVDYTHPRLDNYVEGGFDCVNMIPGMAMDDNGHGTHVAATIVARRTGLARTSKLYAVKVLDENAMGEVSSLIMAIQWAINNEMDIINMSLAFREDNPTVHLAIQKAYEAGIIMVGASGNHSNWIEDGQTSGDGGAGDGGAGDGGAGDGGAGDGGAGDGGAGDGGASGDGVVENPYPVMYPAAYPEVIAVGAHTSFGDVAGFSNTGPEVELTAPGEGIVSSNVMEITKYGTCNGTSMATPHVSGSIALMLSLDRNNMISPYEIREILVNSTTDGKLNLVGALEEVQRRQ